jgi:hypothetical protein
MERMGVRVFERHLDVLERARAVSGRAHPTAALLAEVLPDERAHVRGCERALERLVASDERAALAGFLARVDRLERRFGVTEALGLWALGAALGLSALGAAPRARA